MTDILIKEKSPIIIVDDDYHTRNAISLVLKENGYQILEFETAPGVLDALKNYPCEIVLTDIRMPGITGLELLEDIRTSFPDMPVILMTGFADFSVAVEAIRKGAFDFLLKPVHPDMLLNTIKKAEEHNRLIQLEKEYHAKELRASHERLLTVLDSLDSAVYVADMDTYEILYANKYIKNNIGDIEGKICWQTIQADQSGPCSFCTNDKLLTEDGRPAGVYVWKFKNSITNRWYLIHDQAVKWVDGRTVRLEIATDITDQKIAEDILKRSHEQLRVFAKHLQNAREEERAKIAREIHDEFAQSLTVLKIDLSDISRDIKQTACAEKEDLVSKLQGISLFIDGIIENVQRIAMDLRPSILDDIGLEAAIEWHINDFKNRTGIECIFIKKGLINIDIDKDRSTAIFRILQEALTNVARHSDASGVRVLLRSDEKSVSLEVQDNGRGISEESIQNPNSLGLMGIRERVEIFNGTFYIKGEKDIGTNIYVSIPLK